jgi:single-strand DNA-binding protein
MNTVNAIGRFVSDPEFKMAGDKELTTFTVAVDERYGDHTNFFDCQAWGKTAEVIANHFNKGKQIGISGRLKQDRWEKDGQKRSRVFIVVENFTFCGKKDD